MPGHYCTAKKAAQDAYEARSWVADARPSQPQEEERKESWSNNVKGKGKSQEDPQSGIEETLTQIMDQLNIHTKLFESLKE